MTDDEKLKKIITEISLSPFDSEYDDMYEVGEMYRIYCDDGKLDLLIIG